VLLARCARQRANRRPGAGADSLVAGRNGREPGCRARVRARAVSEATSSASKNDREPWRRDRWVARQRRSPRRARP
jgi:hypothetical protein